MIIYLFKPLVHVLKALHGSETEANNIISQLKVELDPNKRITTEQQHEQSVAIYDILDENYFALQNHSGPYCLYMRTDSRHIYFDIRD